MNAQPPPPCARCSAGQHYTLGSGRIAPDAGGERVHPDGRRRAARRDPLPARDRGPVAGPARGLSVSQGRRLGVAGGLPPAAGRGRLRGVPGRHARDRIVGRGGGRRVPAVGGRRHVRGHRLARRAAVVHRGGRHVRELVCRIRHAARRDARAARPPRDRAALCDRRPLHRRRPLRRRHPQGDRVQLPAVDGRPERAAAGARPRRRRLARAVAAADRRARAVVPVDRGAERRALLAPRLASAPLRPDPGPDDGDRRLERPLPELRRSG